MAEEPVDEEQEAAPAQPAPSSGPGRYLMLIILILVFEAVGGYMVLDRAIPAPEEVPQEEEEVVEKPKPKAPRYYTGLKQMIANPISARGTNLVQMTFALEVSSEAAQEELEIKHQVIWDLILQKLESYSIEEIRDPLKKKLKEDLKRLVNAELKNGRVTAVYVTDIVVQ